jgi:hypothetical protein
MDIEVNVMRRSFVVVALIAAMSGPALLAGQVDVGVSVSDGRLQSFYMAVGDHYRAAPDAVVALRSRYRLSDEELPVVYFLAARAHVGPQAVVDLRLGKRSWFDIAVHFGLSPEIFFVPVRMETIGPPYGNAYGYYRKYGRAGDWRKFAPADREVIDLVNLRFMSEYHRLPPDDIIVMRGRQKSYVGINDEIGKGKGKDKAASGKSQKPESKGKKK